MKKTQVDTAKAGENYPYNTPEQYFPDALLGKLFGAQDWKNHYPKPTGGKSDRPRDRDTGKFTATDQKPRHNSTGVGLAPFQHRKGGKSVE